MHSKSSSELNRKVRELIALKESLYKQLHPSSPKIVREITAWDLHLFLKDVIPDKDVKIWLVDAKYKLTTEEELDKVLRIVLPEAWRYLTDFADCDDAAFRLTGLLSIGEWASLAMGFTIGNTHAFFSAVLDDNGKLIFRIIEPQIKYGDIFDYEEAKRRGIYIPLLFIIY